MINHKKAHPLHNIAKYIFDYIKYQVTFCAHHFAHYKLYTMVYIPEYILCTLSF